MSRGSCGLSRDIIRRTPRFYRGLTSLCRRNHDAKVVIEQSSVSLLNGQKVKTPPTREIIKASTRIIETKGNESEETIKVGTKSYKCKVVDAQENNHGIKSSTKSWTCPEVPGLIVKTFNTTEGSVKSELVITLVAVEPAK